MNRLWATVGLCVKDDSLSKIAAVNTGNTANGWNNGWGDGWMARSTDGQYTVEGIVACLSVNTKNDDKPSSWEAGPYGWCNVMGINHKNVSGAWIFDHTYASYDSCRAHAATGCADCVRNGKNMLCTRSALFAPL
jgi:hypothetical protein